MIGLFPSREIALSIGSLSIHWYGLLYLYAFLLGDWLIPRLMKYRGIELNEYRRNELLIHCILGVLIGGRLGYALFYGLDYFLQHPLEILAVWNGGMSSHGGFIGVTVALLLFCRKQRMDVFALADVLTVPFALGLACGRFGNLLNQELYGTVTTLPWGMAFSHIEGIRHPTQIYAMLKDLAIALVCSLHLKRRTEQFPSRQIGQASMRGRAGRNIALFLMLYGALRFAVEFFREQPFGLTGIGPVSLSTGQLLTIPVFVAGGALWIVRRPRSIQPSSLTGQRI